MNDTILFHATLMPDDDWWHALWPDPKSVLQQVGIKPGMQVVDLCCGNGHFTQPMTELVENGHVYGLDLDEPLLAQAKEICRSATNFTPILADAMNLPNEIDAAVDFVFIANTFHGAQNQTDLSRAVLQSLKPGGRFSVVNWHHRPREETPVLGLPRGPAKELRMTPDEVRKSVEPSGLKFEKVVDVGPYHYAINFVKE